MDKPNEEIDLVFIDDVSKRGTAIKYIEFKDSKFRLSETQKEVIKEICQGYFFYSKTKKMWGFTTRNDNHLKIYDYIKTGKSPIETKSPKQKVGPSFFVNEEPIPLNLKEYDVKFVNLKGRPFFYYDIVDGIVEVKINLAHWFFSEKNNSEKEIAKKIVTSLIGAGLEYTSSVIDSYFVKLLTIQENMKYTYDQLKSTDI